MCRPACGAALRCATATSSPGSRTSPARRRRGWWAADAGSDLIAVYGGDGTLMEVINGLMGREVTIGVLPGGTGNTVAADLGIPLNLADALRVLATSTARRRLDVGEVNGRYFLLRAYTGVGSDKNASREMKARLGVLAYPISGLRFLKEHPTAEFHITVDGQQIDEPGILRPAHRASPRRHRRPAPASCGATAPAASSCRSPAAQSAGWPCGR